MVTAKHIAPEPQDRLWDTVLYRITDAGREALDDYTAGIVPKKAPRSGAR